MRHLVPRLALATGLGALIALTGTPALAAGPTGSDAAVPAGPAAATPAAARALGPPGIGSPVIVHPESSFEFIQQAYETTADHRVIQYTWSETDWVDAVDLGGWSRDGVGATLLGDLGPDGVKFGPEAVVIRGSDGAIWYRQSTGLDGPWQPWVSLGGHFTGHPAVTTVTNPRAGQIVVVLARGADGMLYERDRSQGRWTARWARIRRAEGIPTLSGGAAYLTGTDGTIRKASRTAALRPTWTAWTALPRLPGGAASEPGLDRNDVCALDHARRAWCSTRTVPPSSWTIRGDGPFVGAPTFAIETDSTASAWVLYARWPDGRLRNRNFSHEWHAVPAPPPGTADPTAPPLIPLAPDPAPRPRPNPGPNPPPNPAPIRPPAAAPDLPATGPGVPVGGLAAVAALCLVTGGLVTAAARRRARA